MIEFSNYLCNKAKGSQQIGQTSTADVAHIYVYLWPEINKFNYITCLKQHMNQISQKNKPLLFRYKL